MKRIHWLKFEGDRLSSFAGNDATVVVPFKLHSAHPPRVNKSLAIISIFLLTSLKYDGLIGLSEAHLMQKN